MLRSEFCPVLSAAIDVKLSADAELLLLRQEMRDGTVPYSKSAVISAMENCDDALEGVWLALKPTVMAVVRQSSTCLTN